VAALRLAITAMVLVIAAPARAESVAEWRPYITEASLRFGVPTAWIEEVMRAESNGQTKLNGHPIRSRAGAVGLMQLMPGTWEAMRRRLGLGSNPDDPRDNVLAGTFFLRLMYDRFGYPGLFAAYNAGPGRYAAHLTSGNALPAETSAYLRTVTGVPSAPSETVVQPPRETLFAIRYQAQALPASGAVETSPPSLFAVRHDGQ
jgi:soluble lytic murein transglycosylase-like protein